MLGLKLNHVGKGGAYNRHSRHAGFCMETHVSHLYVAAAVYIIKFLIFFNENPCTFIQVSVKFDPKDSIYMQCYHVNFALND